MMGEIIGLASFHFLEHSKHNAREKGFWTTLEILLDVQLGGKKTHTPCINS